MASYLGVPGGRVNIHNLHGQTMTSLGKKIHYAIYPFRLGFVCLSRYREPYRREPHPNVSAPDGSVSVTLFLLVEALVYKPRVSLFNMPVGILQILGPPRVK